MSKKKWTIEDMQDFAKPKGGKCLSVEYINARTKLKWRCSKGHEWEATPESIKNQHSWCPYCANNVKLTIEEMQKLAALHNGECLSTEYIELLHLKKSAL